MSCKSCRLDTHRRTDRHNINLFQRFSALRVEAQRHEYIAILISYQHEFPRGRKSAAAWGLAAAIPSDASANRAVFLVKRVGDNAVVTSVCRIQEAAVCRNTQVRGEARGCIRRKSVD